MLKNVRQSAIYGLLLKSLLFICILWAANLSYGFFHEAGHAVVVKALGGDVYDIYVNPFGTDAYTIHSFVSGAACTVLLEMAGMAVTTVMAFLSLYFGYTPLPLFFALRTSIYALNYEPGTDIYTIYQAIGNVSLLLSLALVVLNLACAAIAIVGPIRELGYEIPILDRITLRQ